MQALVLTDIVVGATLTALLLVLTIQAYKRGGSLDPREAPAHAAGGQPDRGASRADDGERTAP